MTTALHSPCSPRLICIAGGQRTGADLTQPDNEGDNGDQADDRRPSRDGGPPLLEHGPAMIVKPATAANAELFTSVHAVPVDGGTLPANDAVIHETVVPKEQAEQECLSPDRVGHVLRAAATAAAEPAPTPRGSRRRASPARPGRSCGPACHWSAGSWPPRLVTSGRALNCRSRSTIRWARLRYVTESSPTGVKVITRMVYRDRSHSGGHR